MDTAHGLEGEQEDVASPPVDAANQENIFLVDVSSPIDGPSSAKGASHQVGSHHSNNTSINGREDEDLLVTPRQVLHESPRTQRMPGKNCAFLVILFSVVEQS